MNTERVNPILTAKIVGSYFRQHKVRPEQLPEIITSVHQALGQLGQPDQPEEVLTPAVSGTTFREPRVCGLSPLRLQGKDAPTAHHHAARVEPG